MTLKKKVSQLQKAKKQDLGKGILIGGGEGGTECYNQLPIMAAKTQLNTYSSIQAITSKSMNLSSASAMDPTCNLIIDNKP